MEERIEVQKNQESPRANAVKPSELHQTENEKNEHGDVCENAVQAKYRPKYDHLLKYAKEYEEKCKLMNRGKQNDFKADEKRNVVMEELPEEDERVVSRKRSARGSGKVITEESTESDEQVDIEKRTKFQNDVRKKQSMQEDARVTQCSPYNGKNVVKNLRNKKEATKKKFLPSKSRNVGESSRVAPARSEEVEFRRRVLEIISKPYDMIEYMIIKKEFDSKCYTDDHLELGNELMKWRNNWRKRLSLMRGFYFWIHNLNREGAFKPWRDAVCLAVEPQPLSRGQ